MHTYSVALRITGTDLDLFAVSDTLKVNPTQTRVMGQPRSSSSNFLWPESMWEHEVRPSDGHPVWDSLEKGLQALISTFASREGEIRKYQAQHKVILWCGHFSSSFDGGPILSPEILKSLASFGVELMLDTYASYKPYTE